MGRTSVWRIPARFSASRRSSGQRVRDEQVHGLAEDGGASDALHLPHGLESGGHVFAGDVQTPGAGWIDHGELLEGVGFAADDELRGWMPADVGAPFGLIHVVRGDKQESCPQRQTREVPEFPSGDGIDTGRRFVEKSTWVRAGGAGHGRNAGASLRTTGRRGGSDRGQVRERHEFVTSASAVGRCGVRRVGRRTGGSHAPSVHRRAKTSGTCSRSGA